MRAGSRRLCKALAQAATRRDFFSREVLETSAPVYCQGSERIFTLQRRLASSTIDTKNNNPASRPPTLKSGNSRSLELERAGPLVEYERRISAGHLLPGDKYQEDALRALQALFDLLKSTAAESRLDRTSAEQSHGRSKSWWSELLSPTPSVPSVRGLYLYGGVGTGKTMLMDMFYEQLPSTWRKRRLHFHDFMLNVHSRLQKLKGVTDPLEMLAEELSKEAVILCVDEFMVTDVADALILNRLFGHLWSKGIVLVSTSNRAPDQLYERGLQRDLFLPFIASLKERCVVHKVGSPTDYRKLNAVEKGLYFVGEGASEMLKEKFRVVTNGEFTAPATVEVVMGRRLKVPISANGCAYFQFYELCEMPLGAADYFGLFNHFHTLFLEGVPVFGSHNRVAAYRFVTLIDVLYENKARFVCSAEAPPKELLERIVTIADAPKRTSSRSARNDDADLLVDNELGFAKERTISRLIEMQTKEYIDDHAASRLDDDSPVATGTDS
ncbi:AFG1-like ATPase [Selaginella moellendorffii]|nr:AFG1-like ATPase [Selaginella moellendorffii]|eukprot:XP_024534339.1 AFG1-like ATPase [Selaginella moellendorffii]